MGPGEAQPICSKRKAPNSHLREPRLCQVPMGPLMLHIPARICLVPAIFFPILTSFKKNSSFLKMILKYTGCNISNVYSFLKNVIFRNINLKDFLLLLCSFNKDHF